MSTPRSGVEPTRAEPEDAGCWLDGSRGQYIGEEIQQLAHEQGWSGEMLGVDDEWYCEAWEEAEAYLNEHCAPDGFDFSSNESGDWGLWSTGKECQKCGKRIHYDDLESLGCEPELCEGCRQ